MKLKSLLTEDELSKFKAISEAPKEEDPTADAPDGGEDAPAEEDDMYADSKPKPVQVKFDISTVKHYNPNKTFSQNYGFVQSINKRGVEVQADNHAIVFVNFEDLLDESKKAVKKMQLKEYTVPQQANETLTYLVNFWNENGPEALAQMDTQTLAGLNKIDPTLARDVYSVQQAVKRLQPFIDNYYQKFLSETVIKEEVEKIKYNEFEDAKPPKLTQDKETEAVTVKKKFKIQDVEIKTGTPEEYEKSQSEASQDVAMARNLANALYSETDDFYPTEIDIITDHQDDEVYDNPYLNDFIKVKMSNGDNLTIHAYRGFSAWNPTIKIKRLIVKKGSTIIEDSKETDKWFVHIMKIYQKSLKK